MYDLGDAVVELGAASNCTEATASDITHRDSTQHYTTSEDEVSEVAEGQYLSTPQDCPNWCDKEMWTTLSQEQQHLFGSLHKHSAVEGTACLVPISQ